MYDRFAASKYGVGTVVAFNATGGTEKRLTVTLLRSRPVLLTLLATQDVRIRQGDSSISIGVLTVFLLKKNVYVPCLIEGPSDQCLAIIGDTANSGNLIAIVSDTVDAVAARFAVANIT